MELSGSVGVLFSLSADGPGIHNREEVKMNACIVQCRTWCYTDFHSSFHSVIITKPCAFWRVWRSLAYGTSLHFLPFSLHLTLSFDVIYVNCMAVYVTSIHAVLRPLLSWFLLTAQNSALLPSSAINLAFNVLIVLNSWQFFAHASLFHVFGAFFCSCIFLCLAQHQPFLSWWTSSYPSRMTSDDL